MKLLICTRSDKNISDMTDITHPIIKAYAKRCGAAFTVFKENSMPEHKYHYRIMQIRELLEVYDRVLNLDSDILITPKCPNIFKEVPINKIGTIFEDEGSRQKQRRGLIKQVQEKFGNVNWTTGYINTGVFLVSKQHKNIFETVNGKCWDGWGFDDIHLGWQIRKKEYEIYRLHWRWNNMAMFFEKWNGFPNRFDSYMIHYAGQGKFDSGVKNRMEQIKYDYKAMYG